MKKFFTLIAFTCALIPTINGMEKAPESNNLKRSVDVIDLTGDPIDALVDKKRLKVEETKAVVSNEVAKTIAGYSEATVHSYFGHVSSGYNIVAS